MTARLAAVALAAAILLSGCGAQGAPANGGSGGDSPAPSQPAGTGGELSLPDTFPTDQVPLIEGDIAYAQDLGTGWVFYIHRDDFLGGYDEAVGLLEGAGFTGATAGRDDSGATGQWTTNALTVNLSAGDGTDLGVGPSIGYTVVENGE